MSPDKKKCPYCEDDFVCRHTSRPELGEAGDTQEQTEGDHDFLLGPPLYEAEGEPDAEFLFGNPPKTDPAPDKLEEQILAVLNKNTFQDQVAYSPELIDDLLAELRDLVAAEKEESYNRGWQDCDRNKRTPR